MSSRDAPEPYLTAAEVARWLGYSPSSVDRLCREEGLPFRRLRGRTKRFNRSEVQAWLDARKVEARPVAAPDGPTKLPRSRATAPPVVDWLEEIKSIGKRVP